MSQCTPTQHNNKEKNNNKDKKECMSILKHVKFFATLPVEIWGVYPLYFNLGCFLITSTNTK
jgi:hypothetical protein